ncbi:HD domain-containing protein [Amycolatopsis anabasis]|uniref:HD domain-containing protein n=1 Tax=Amycolatopsis anabasis TaxID=1840409 RepID=UPI00131E7EEE|nr:hypothetical protein [Amycolatopsis anabasis]
MNLANRWISAVEALGGDPAPAAAAADELLSRYGEEHRRFHNLVHVQAVVRDADHFAGELGLGVRERAVLALAACAHDVVYDARPGDDERLSAAWAADRLDRAGLPGHVIDRVERLVLTTANHDAEAGDTVASALLDADLAILAADPDGYDRYLLAVRAEYAAVDDPAWVAGRTRVLRDLLDRRWLYRTETARDHWEAPARRNLTRELVLLREAAE